MFTFKHCLTASLLAATLVAGCSDDDNPAPAATGPAAGLTLATLPAGWKYEGWVVVGGTAISTGTFTNPAAADAAAPFAGANPQPTPPFPGEDFLANAPTGVTFPTDLRSQTVVISIEPSPDDSPGPFTLKPLTATVPAGAADHVAYTMTNAASAFPTGTATISGTTLTLAFTGLDPLSVSSGYKYEGWALIGGAPVTTGTFDIVNGSPNPSTFTGITNLSSATAIIITIEPNPDPSPDPSDTHIVAGDVASGTANLTVGHAAALGNTFATAAGTYILATPSDGTGTPENERSGVWFLTP
ncbi:MAG: hypothetical protein ABIO65_09180 [Nitrospiria bacterium]